MRLPFGLNCAPEVFIKLNQKYFGNIDPNDIIIYFDDILVATETIEKHDLLLNKIVETARKNNVKFNKEKVKFKQNEVKFIGQIFDKNGYRPDNEKVEAILQLREPSNRKELQSILGMVNYLRDFIPNMAKITSPLRELLKKISNGNGAHDIRKH